LFEFWGVRGTLSHPRKSFIVAADVEIAIFKCVQYSSSGLRGSAAFGFPFKIGKNWGRVIHISFRVAGCNSNIILP